MAIEDNRIKVVQNRLELKSVYEIKMFIGFANIYQYFIKHSSKIAILLLFLIKITSPSLVKDDKVKKLDGRNGNKKDRLIKKLIINKKILK